MSAEISNEVLFKKMFFDQSAYYIPCWQLTPVKLPLHMQ